ncbi:MAG TPA: DUF5808 domain-containing protein [Trebonia sp.]|jgi:hypothetical protein|nr:DUF5808 domain-containing protein [Trebonia sp.]
MSEIPEPQGRFAGVPYDWRIPTPEKFKARWWNPGDTRVLTPRAFGWGYDLNLYWLAHPAEFWRRQQRQ